MSKPKQAETTIAEYESALHRVLDELEAKDAELARIKGQLEALTSAFDAAGSLGVLQQIAHDKRLAPELRAKAAGLAVPFERPRLSMTATTTLPSLFDLLEERRRQGKVIEHAPDPDPPAA